MSRRIASVVDYAGLQRALRQRKEALKISHTTLDALLGSEGYCSKLLSENPKKNIGITMLGTLLGALCLRLHVVEDRYRMRKLRDRLVPRNENQVRHRRRASNGTAHARD